jgi:hypothetical protein
MRVSPSRRYFRHSAKPGRSSRAPLIRAVVPVESSDHGVNIHGVFL